MKIENQNEHEQQDYFMHIHDRCYGNFSRLGHRNIHCNHYANDNRNSNLPAIVFRSVHNKSENNEVRDANSGQTINRS